MPDSEKIDAMFGMLHEIKPVVLDIKEGQKAMDTRLRVVEGIGVAHEVKISRIQSDMDGLGRKVRSYQPLSNAEERGEPRGGKWLAFLEVLAVLPQYWHVCLSIGMAALTLATILIRHKIP